MQATIAKETNPAWCKILTTEPSDKMTTGAEPSSPSSRAVNQLPANKPKCSANSNSFNVILDNELRLKHLENKCDAWETVIPRVILRTPGRGSIPQLAFHSDEQLFKQIKSRLQCNNIFCHWNSSPSTQQLWRVV